MTDFSNMTGFWEAVTISYARMLIEQPPVASTNPARVGNHTAEQNAREYAKKDIARLQRAIARRGLTITLHEQGSMFDNDGQEEPTP